MEEQLLVALVGVGGIVVGALLGGIAKYFGLRRDAWTQARASGLLLLADVRAVRDAGPTDPRVADASDGMKVWESQRMALALFRRGNFPHGFKATEWLTLAACFERLRGICATPHEHADRHSEWWKAVDSELGTAEDLLARFEKDPAVFFSVLGTGIRKYATLGRATEDEPL